MRFYDRLDVMMGHFEKSGGFLTVRDAGGRVNTMTISWGFAGVIWSKPHFVTVVRPSRYTYELLKTADSFTVSVPFGGLKDELRVCGAESGRDVDKSKIVEFAPSKSVDSPIVAGCDFYYECIINYRDGLHGGKMPPAIDKAHYNGDWHDFFIGEIVEVY